MRLLVAGYMKCNAGEKKKILKENTNHFMTQTYLSRLVCDI